MNHQQQSQHRQHQINQLPQPMHHQHHNHSQSEPQIENNNNQYSVQQYQVVDDSARVNCNNYEEMMTIPDQKTDQLQSLQQFSDQNLNQRLLHSSDQYDSQSQIQRSQLDFQPQPSTTPQLFHNHKSANPLFNSNYQQPFIQDQQHNFLIPEQSDLNLNGSKHQPLQKSQTHKQQHQISKVYDNSDDRELLLMNSLNQNPSYEVKNNYSSNASTAQNLKRHLYGLKKYEQAQTQKSHQQIQGQHQDQIQQQQNSQEVETNKFDSRKISHKNHHHHQNPLSQSAVDLQNASNNQSQNFFRKTKGTLQSSKVMGQGQANDLLGFNEYEGQVIVNGEQLSNNFFSGEGTLKTSQNFGSSLNRDLPQSFKTIRQDSADLSKSQNQNQGQEIKQTRNLSQSKLIQNSQIPPPYSQNSSSQNKQVNQQARNNNSSSSKPPPITSNIHFQLSQTQGIKRVERVYKNPQLAQSMSSGITLKNSQNQIQYPNLASQKQQSNLHNQNHNSTIQISTQPLPNQVVGIKRNRCESVGISQTTLAQKDRNCGPYPNINNESRMRKRSKEVEVKKREKFADLIVILGIKYEEFVDKERLKPQVVGGYPDLNDKEFVKQHNYVENLIWICFPEGFQIQPFEKKKDGELCQMKMFHFIITNQDGDKKYITSILFKELFLSEKKGAFMVPKSICIISSKPLFTLQKQLLSVIFQKVILDINGISIKAFSKERSQYQQFIQQHTKSLLIENSQHQKNNSNHHQLDQYLMRKIEFYLSIFFNHLYYSEEVDQDIEIEEIRERHLPCANAHASQGDNKQQQNHNQYCGPNCHKRKHRHKEKIVDCYFRFRNTKTYGFTLENYSFELLLQSLKPERILFLITALLLERKIILIKENFGDIALIMESLVSLLNPLKWNFVFITYLTPKLVECLEAPFPYIIGVSRKVWDDWCVMREYPDDIIIFDIDNQELLNQVREELPALPQPQASVLQRSLKDMLDIKERFIETIQENATKKVSKDKMEEYYWAYAQIRVKQSFFNFFLLTINNYIGYFKNLDEEGNLSPNKKDKKFYDKLSSNDVFDFDNYLNQFEGYNKEFMLKFVRTQSFNNFIEETYKNTTPQSVIGFFQTNLEVMIDYSFKKLKKEQNKLLDKTFFNLQNPVKFNIGHMYRQYKKQLITKHAAKFRKILEEEQQIQSQLEDPAILGEPSCFDIYQRNDLLEKHLLEDIENRSNQQQLSILNEFRYELVTSMPGIQYDQISTYEQIKSQRSDQSQDRRIQNKTVVHGKSQHAFDFQQSSLSLNAGEPLGLALDLGDRSVSVAKSRNLGGKIITSRSGDLITKSFTTKHSGGALGLGGHKRSQGGVIYDNFLSMENNTNGLLLSHQEQDFKDFLNEQKNVVLTKNHKQSQLELMKLNDKIYQKYRVNSENKHHHPSFSLNKTLDLNTNLNSALRAQAQTQQQNLLNSKKSSTTRNNTLHQSQIVSSLNNTQGFMKQILSPQGQHSSNDINNNFNSNNNDNSQHFGHKRTTGGSKSFYKERSIKQQTVLKEALTRQIQKERSKYGLKQEESKDFFSNQQGYTQNDFRNGNSSILSPNNQSQSNLAYMQQNQEERDQKTTQIITNPYKSNRLNNNRSTRKIINNSQSAKYIQAPQTQIDLMNPRQKKLSRNEERKLAMKKGFMNPQQHESFYQFLYSPNEELNKLALMQIIQRKVESGQIKPGKNKDYQIQQRLYSPSIANTEKSSIRKGEKKRLDFGNNISQENDQLLLDSASQLDFKQVNNMQALIHSSHPGDLYPNQSAGQKIVKHQNSRYRNLVSDNIYENKQIPNKNSIDLSMSKSMKESSLTHILKSSRKQQEDDMTSLAGLTGDENLDSIETRPLKIIQDEMMMSSMLGKTHVMNLKQSKIHNHSSPQHAETSKLMQNSIQQKQKLFGLSMKEKNYSQQQQNNINSQPTVRKEFKTVNPNNKSPLITQAKNIRNPREKNQSSGGPQFFEQSTANQNRNKDTLNRKRSTPALANEKSPQASFKQSMKQPIQVKGSQQDQLQQQFDKKNGGLQSLQYFKKRPLNQNQSKALKNSQVIATTTVDLALKQKYRDQLPSKIDNSKGEMQSLRISPIPNLTQILQSKDLNPQQNNTSSGGVSEDQVVFKNSRGDSNNLNRTSMLQNNFSSNLNPLSLNYQSRQSEKSMTNQLNIPGDMMFSSISHLIEQDLFERAHMTLNGPQTARNDSNYKSNLISTSKTHKKEGNHHHHNSNNNFKVFSMSQRASSNLQQNLNLRASHVSGEGQVRPSNTSSNNDLFKFRKEQSNQKLMLLENNSRHSDVLSQYEPKNNISISILKSSPRMVGKTFSRTSKNQIASDMQLYNSSNNKQQQNQIMAKQSNFMIQGSSNDRVWALNNKQESIQQSVLTSNDTQNMKSLLNALKQNLPHSATTTASISQNNLSRIQTSKNKQNNNQQSKLVQKPILNGSSINVVNIDLNRAKQNNIISPKGLSGQKLKEANIINKSNNSSAIKMMPRNSSIEEVKRNINMSVESSKKETTKTAFYGSNVNYGSTSNFNSQRQVNNQIQINRELNRKKHVRSPQPLQEGKNLQAQIKGLQSLQSQEFNLKDKAYRDLNNQNMSNFSSEPIVELTKEANKASSKRQKLNQGVKSNTNLKTSASKILAINHSDRSHIIKELDFNNISVDPQQHDNIQFKERSTKAQEQQNLSSQNQNKLDFIREIDQVNIVLRNLQGQNQTLKNYNKQGDSYRIKNDLILEEPFQPQNDKSHISRSDFDDYSHQSSIQSSPQMHYQQNQHQSSIKGIQNTQIFKTLNNNASSKISGVNFNNQSQFVQQITDQGLSNGQSDKEKDLITVRNQEFPFKYFNEESRMQAMAAKESMIMHQSKIKHQESTDEIDYENQDIDLPPLQLNISQDDSTIQNSNKLHYKQNIQHVKQQEVDEEDRASKINKEVDILMNEMLPIRNGSGLTHMLRGSKTSKSKVIISKNSNLRNREVSSREDEQEREEDNNGNSIDLLRVSKDKFLYRMRIQSQYQKPNKRIEPLNEIKQNQNKLNAENHTNLQKKQSYKDQRRSDNHIGSYKSENSLSQYENSSKNSNAASIDNNNILNHQYSYPFQKQKKEDQKKRRQQQRHHGLTTCFALPQAKESAQYIRRDLNLDAFCKINSHIGDVDNDPHTPKSDVTLSSHDKNSKKKRKFGRSKPPTFYNDDGSNNFVIQQQDNQKQEQIKYLRLAAKQNTQNGSGGFEIEDIISLRNHSSSVDSRQYQQFQFRQRNQLNNESREQRERIEDVQIQNMNEIEIDNKINSHNPQTLVSDATENQDYHQLDNEIPQLNKQQSNWPFNKPHHQHQNQDLHQSLDEDVHSDSNQHKQDSQTYQVMFEDVDLSELDDKFTSRDTNFNRLKQQQQLILQQQQLLQFNHPQQRQQVQNMHQFMNQNKYSDQFE